MGITHLKDSLTIPNQLLFLQIDEFTNFDRREIDIIMRQRRKDANVKDIDARTIKYGPNIKNIDSNYRKSK